jgi:hypothetical protein
MKQFKTSKFDVAVFLIAHGKNLIGLSGRINSPDYIFYHDSEIKELAQMYSTTSGSLKYCEVTKSRDYLAEEFRRFRYCRQNQLILARDYDGPMT